MPTFKAEPAPKGEEEKKPKICWCKYLSFNLLYIAQKIRAVLTGNLKPFCSDCAKEEFSVFAPQQLKCTVWHERGVRKLLKTRQLKREFHLSSNWRGIHPETILVESTHISIHIFPNTCDKSPTNRTGGTFKTKSLWLCRWHQSCENKKKLSIKTRNYRFSHGLWCGTCCCFAVSLEEMLEIITVACEPQSQ